jgi:hypothetical protein
MKKILEGYQANRDVSFENLPRGKTGQSNVIAANQKKVKLKRKPNKIKQFICERCGNEYELKRISNRKRLKLCKECIQSDARKKAREARYYQYPKYKIKSRKWRLKKYYNLSLDDYERMLKRQNGLCIICKKDNGNRPLVVDHSHSLNKVRGLLCDKCNRAIGAFDDDPIVLQNAVLYLMGEGENYEKN